MLSPSAFVELRHDGLDKGAELQLKRPVGMFHPGTTEQDRRSFLILERLQGGLEIGDWNPSSPLLD